MKLIRYEPMPFLYDLFWRPEESAIGVRILTQVFAEMFKGAEEWPISKHYTEKFGMGPVVSDPDTGFGFGETVFQRVDDSGTGEYITLSRQLPRILIGRGKTENVDHDAGKRFTRTLGLMLEVLSIVEDLPITDRMQYATYQVVFANRDMHAYPLSGEFSPELVQALASQGGDDLPAIKQAMQQAFIAMYPKQIGNFRASSRPDGRFHLSVPGDCACLGVDGNWDGSGGERGYEFGSHNVDTSIQQLSLLVGTITLAESAQGLIKT
jgi:hypothetical protein